MFKTCNYKTLQKGTFSVVDVLFVKYLVIYILSKELVKLVCNLETLNDIFHKLFHKT